MDQQSVTMCTLLRNNTRGCIKPVNEVLEKCLPERSREIPGFVVDVMIDLVDHMCTYDGEHLLGKFVIFYTGYSKKFVLSVWFIPRIVRV